MRRRRISRGACPRDPRYVYERRQSGHTGVHGGTYAGDAVFYRRIKTENLLPEFQNFEVYVDSPLAVEATTIFGKNVQDCFDDTALALVQQGINPIGFPGLRMAITSDESKMINFNDKPKVILSRPACARRGGSGII